MQSKKVRLIICCKRNYKCNGKVRYVWPGEDWHLLSDEKKQFGLCEPSFSASVIEQRIERN